MAAAIPIFKVGVLLVKQATKPMARALKSRALTSERLARLCNFLGQQWHTQTTRLNLIAQGHKVKGIKPLNDQEAVQGGAELLSESFVLSVGIAALIAETKRSAKAAAEKSAQKEARRVAKQEAFNLQLANVTKLIRETVEYQIELRQALELASGKKIPAPELPEDLKALLESSKTNNTNNEKKTTENKHQTVQVFISKPEEKEHEVPTWKVVLPQLSTSGITSLIRYIGSIFNRDDDDGGGSSADDDTDIGGGGDDDI
jgi:hypothetical protein